MKRAIGFIKMNIPTRNNFLSKKIIDLVSLFAIRIIKKNTRIPTGNKFVSIMLGSRDEAKRTKGSKVKVRRSMTI